MRKERFDTAIILHPTNRCHIIAFLAGIPNRIGLNRKLPMLLTKALDDEKFLGQKHELEYTLGILKSLGIEGYDRDLYVPINKSNRSSVNRKLSQRGIRDSDLIIALHPDASG